MMEYERTGQSGCENIITLISEEEENYVRMSLLLSGICPRAVRVLFDSAFHPSCVGLTIKKAHTDLIALTKKRIINQSQWELLFPSNGVVNPESFDVTLMITLLINLADFNHYDKLPFGNDTSPAADLRRLKYYRNHISHNKDGKIDNSSFSKAWVDIIEAIRRLGGQVMLEECQELRTKRLERSTVPWNIKVLISQTLESWKINDKFIETRAATHVFECVQQKSCVTITASSGVGKTATLRHVALKMADEGYDVLLVTNPHDIVKYYNPNQKTLFVMDDFCGTYSVNELDLNCIESVMERITELIQNKTIKIIVACRLQVYQDEKFELLSIFRSCVCNLLSEDLCLSKMEKKTIADQYLGTKASEVIQYCDLFDCFPLLCKLYNDNPKLDFTNFFKNPFSVYKIEIDNLSKKGHNRKYCALALCVIFNNRLKEEWLTVEVDKEKRKIIKNTCESCKLDRGTSPLVLADEMKYLEHTFIKKERDIYKTIHDKMFDFLTYYFGQTMIYCLIKNADSWLITQRFLLENKDGMDQFITIVPSKYHEMYMERTIDDWFKGKVQQVFNNINLQIPKFRHRYLCYINKFNISIQRQLALICDVQNKDTVLLQCCQYDDMPLIQWCIYLGVNVNQCNINGVSPLYRSTQVGHVEIVKVLLKKKADINKCTNHGTSPLFIACQNNHLEIVKVLIDSKADIYKCTDTGASPLFAACQNNHIAVVKELLDKKADIIKCTDSGASPLFIACLNNHKAIIKILLDNKADINKCTDKGASPLSVACLNNDKETVKVLLDNKADINKCEESGGSPLFIACQNNHIETVKILLDNNADINKCLDNGASPLYSASQKNHIETVKVLLDNKADINKCRDNGASPLFVACLANHIEIAKVLLDNKADINKCTDEGVSPIFIACQNKHTEIVQILLDNKADINKCTGDGISPLYIACQNNHTEIVNLILGNKADINKCTDNGTSPLYYACLNNHIEIVKILVSNKADINKCSGDGKSPLHIASQMNHIEAVKVLLGNKTDIDICTDNGVSPLIVACMNNHTETVKVLLACNADIDKCTDDGSTPLFISCQNNDIKTVEVLCYIDTMDKRLFLKKKP